jgi:hypothetical protein
MDTDPPTRAAPNVWGDNAPNGDPRTTTSSPCDTQGSAVEAAPSRGEQRQQPRLEIGQGPFSRVTVPGRLPRLATGRGGVPPSSSTAKLEIISALPACWVTFAKDHCTDHPAPNSAASLSSADCSSVAHTTADTMHAPVVHLSTCLRSQHAAPHPKPCLPPHNRAPTCQAMTHLARARCQQHVHCARRGALLRCTAQQ